MTAKKSKTIVVLKPCPFCGSSAHFERVGTTKQSCIVACDDCHCSLESNETWSSGRAWNERAETAQKKDEHHSRGSKLLPRMFYGYNHHAGTELIKDIEVRMVLPNGIELCLTIDKDSQALCVRSNDGRLVIKPVVANMLHIQAEDPD